MNTKLVKVEDKPQLEIHLDIRRKVFQEEQGIDPQLDMDKNDKSKKTNHYIFVQEDLPIGAVRWREGSIGYKIERFCIVKDYRNKGLGMEMLKCILLEIPVNQKVYLGAQEGARKFYEKAGFRVTGSPYWEAGILHHRMVIAKTDRKKVLEDILNLQMKLNLN